MRRFLLPLVIAVPALIGTGAKASDELVWSYTPSVTPLLLAQTEGDETDLEEQQDDNDWRLYLDLYGFLPPENEGTVKLDGNSNTGNLSLSDILENVSSIATFRAGLEYGRFGIQTGIFHGAVDFNDSASAYTTSEGLTLRGDVEGDFHLDQT